MYRVSSTSTKTAPQRNWKDSFYRHTADQSAQRPTLTGVPALTTSPPLTFNWPETGKRTDSSIKRDTNNAIGQSQRITIPNLWFSLSKPFWTYSTNHTQFAVFCMLPSNTDLHRGVWHQPNRSSASAANSVRFSIKLTADVL